ncbi:MAG: hypothetical protein IJ111_12100 [Eggerthellaceae bacterium]|nr:hypothetical protein [Eggerthellaceae bacterium]
MTIELAVAMPVLIIVAVIATNAVAFFADCAVFDRVAHEATRVHAASPAYGQGADQSCALISREIEEAIAQPNVEVSVRHSGTGFDFDQFTATIEFHPTLFGLGLRSEVFGVALPSIAHSTTYVVDCYKPGVIA